MSSNPAAIEAMQEIPFVDHALFAILFVLILIIVLPLCILAYYYIKGWIIDFKEGFHTSKGFCYCKKCQYWIKKNKEKAKP